MWGTIAGLAGGLLSNWMDDERQEDANNFSASQAAENRSFQERLSNTAYQRTTKDMIAAGLNPMLAYSQGGASTPSGSSAQSQAPKQAINPIPAAAQSALTVAQTQNTEAQTGNVVQDTAKKEAETEEINARLIDEHGNDRTGGKRKWSSLEAAKLNAETDRIGAQSRLTSEQQRLVKEQIKNAVETNSNIKADTGNKEADRVLKDLASYAAENEAAHQFRYRDWNIDYRPFIKEGATGLGALGSAFKNFRLPRGR